MTETTCRREETALCNPHGGALRKLKLLPPTTVPEQLGACEKQTMTEKQFLRDHSLYSAMSSWLFAIAGATNIGVLCAISSKVLMAAEQGLPIFKSKDPTIKPVMSNKRYNRIALSMVAFGGVCMSVSNWLESKKVVTEWQLGAGKLQRKVNIAENKAGADEAQVASAEQHSAKIPTSPGGKNWGASVQPRGDSFSERKETAAAGVAAIG